MSIRKGRERTMFGKGHGNTNKIHQRLFPSGLYCLLLSKFFLDAVVHKQPEPPNLAMLNTSTSLMEVGRKIPKRAGSQLPYLGLLLTLGNGHSLSTSVLELTSCD